MLKIVCDEDVRNAAPLAPVFVNKPVFLIGRSLAADFVIADRQISRRHCCIYKRNETYSLIDMSTCGLNVNGKTIGQGVECPLNDNDMIELTDTLKYRFHVSNSKEVENSKKMLSESSSRPVIVKNANVSVENGAPDLVLKKMLGEELERRSKLEASHKIAVQSLSDEKERLGKELLREELEKRSKLEASYKAVVLSLKEEENILEKKLSENKLTLETANKTVIALQDANRCLQMKLSAKEFETLSLVASNKAAEEKWDKKERLQEKLLEAEREKRTKLKDSQKAYVENLQADINRLEMNLSAGKHEKRLLETTYEADKLKWEEKQRSLLEKYETSQKNLKHIKETLEKKLLREEEAKRSVETAHRAVEQNLREKVHLEKQLSDEERAKRLELTLDVLDLKEERERLQSRVRDLEVVAARLDKLEQVTENEVQCAICFELVVGATTLGCSHTFCEKCIEEWRDRAAQVGAAQAAAGTAQAAPQCPTCRAKIRRLTRCKMLDAYVSKVSDVLGPAFRERRRQVLKERNMDSQCQVKRQCLGGGVAATSVPQPEAFVDLTTSPF